VLGQRQQAFLLGRDGGPLVGVQVHHEVGVFAIHMDRRVDGESRRIDKVGRLLEDGALAVDLNQRRGGDLVEPQAVGIDQEVVLRSRHAGGDVGVDHVVPPEERRKPVERGQVDSRLPFFLGDLALQRDRTRQRSIGH
jgi:hypothetical protein